MRKNVVKIFCLLIILFVVLSSLNVCFATVPGILDAVDESFVEAGGGTGKIQNLGGIILKAVQVVGTTAALVTIIICAMKYMLAAPEGKAEYKKRLTPIVIGSIILFAAANILTLIQSTVNTAIT